MHDVARTSSIKQCVGSLKRASNVYDVFRALKAASQDYDFSAFAVFNLHDIEMSGTYISNVISNWPPEFMQAYDEMELIKTSPYLQHFKTSTAPFIWEIDDLLATGDDELDRKARQLFDDFKFVRGVYYSVHSVDSDRAAVAFAGDRDELEESEIAELGLVANLAFNRLCALKKCDERKPQSALTEREIEVIQWISQGKTSAEIAAILELSEHTVNHHFTMACRKLNAVNRTHAISTALRQGLIK